MQGLFLSQTSPWNRPWLRTLSLNPTKQARADCRPNELPILSETGIFKMSHRHDYVKYDRKPTERKNRISHADAESGIFKTKLFLKKYRYVTPSQIAPSCHIVFVSRLCFPSLPTHFKDKMHHSSESPLSTRNSAWRQLSVEVDGGVGGGGGGGKRVKQASASSVPRHHRCPRRGRG